jgi:hypothetical protein
MPRIAQQAPAFSAGINDIIQTRRAAGRTPAVFRQDRDVLSKNPVELNAKR